MRAEQSAKSSGREKRGAAGKGQARVVLPFLVSLVVCTVIFGILGLTAALFSTPEPESSSVGQVAEPLGSGSCNMLLFEQDETTGDAIEILLLRLDGDKNSLTVAPVPACLTVPYRGGETALGRVFGLDGANDAADAFCSLTKVKVQYRAVITAANLQSLIDGMGGIIYNLPVDMSVTLPSASSQTAGRTVTLISGSQLLSGEKSAAALAGASRLGWRRRAGLQGGLMKAFLLQKMNESYLGAAGSDAEDFYKKTFSLTETNWSMHDLVTWVDTLRGLQGTNRDFVRIAQLVCLPQDAPAGQSVALTTADYALLRDDFEAGH